MQRVRPASRVRHARAPGPLVARRCRRRQHCPSSCVAVVRFTQPGRVLLVSRLLWDPAPLTAGLAASTQSPPAGLRPMKRTRLPRGEDGAFCGSQPDARADDKGRAPAVPGVPLSASLRDLMTSCRACA